MITGAIFDMDGVLLDTMPVWENADILYLEALGKKAEPGLGDVLLTKTMTEAAEYIRVNYDLKKTVEEIVQDIIEIVEVHYKTKPLMKAGALEFIRNLKKNGIAVTVATSSDRELAVAGLSNAGILPYLDGIFTCSEAGAGKKSSPAVYVQAQKFMGTKAEDTWVFEDVLHGIRSAKKAGFRTVGIYDASSAQEQKNIRQEASIYLENLEEFEPFYIAAKKYVKKDNS